MVVFKPLNRQLFQQRSGTGEFQLALDRRFQNRPA
jgi:hypothetical protein